MVFLKNFMQIDPNLLTRSELLEKDLSPITCEVVLLTTSSTGTVLILMPTECKISEVFLIYKL